MRAFILAAVIGATFGGITHGGSLSRLAPMQASRAAHTLTTLADGRVLVLGGMGAEAQPGVAASAFDPISSEFSPLDVGLRFRHSHTATTLADGTVLIVGGYGPDQSYLADAQLFDPRTNRTRDAGRLVRARAGHRATLLRDGRVLITGGVGEGWTFLRGAEIYDPATGTFSSTQAMLVARESHVAVRLNDGRVLVVGGHEGRRSNIRIHQSAEIFDPANGRFESAGDMVVARHKHDAAILADGRVLILGGADERDSRGVYRSTEIYDPVQGRFLEHGRMAVPRYKHRGTTVVLADGRLLLAGGASQIEIYEPSADRFRRLPSEAQLKGQFSAAALLEDGRVLIAGGYGTGQGPTAEAWVFTPSDP